MKKIKRIISILFVIYLAILFFILFLYGARTGNQFHLEIFAKEHFDMVNYIPFATINTFFERLRDNSLNSDIIIRNIAANFMMFIPMGMALPVLFEKTFDKWWKILLFVVVLVLLLEIIQFITFCGSADVDDMILNTIGAMIGYGVIQIKYIRKLLKMI